MIKDEIYFNDNNFLQSVIRKSPFNSFGHPSRLENFLKSVNSISSTDSGNPIKFSILLHSCIEIRPIFIFIIKEGCYLTT